MASNGWASHPWIEYQQDSPVSVYWGGEGCHVNCLRHGGSTSSQDGTVMMLKAILIPKPSNQLYQHFCKFFFPSLRCHLPSGKTMWLCPEHQQSSRVTVLGSDVTSENPIEIVTESSLIAALRLHEESEYVKVKPWTEVWNDCIPKKKPGMSPKKYLFLNS